MDRTKAIAVLLSVKHFFKMDTAENEALDMAIKALEGKDTNVPTKWIPVTPETMPEEGKVVVAYGDGKTWDVGMYKGHGDDITIWHWKKNTFKRVYWWMYKKDALPGQWKGE